MTCCSDKLLFTENHLRKCKHGTLLTYSLLYRYKRLLSVCFVTAFPASLPRCFFSKGFCHLEFMQRSDSFSSLLSLLTSTKRCLSDLLSMQPHPQPLQLQTVTSEISQKGLAKALAFAGCLQYRKKKKIEATSTASANSGFYAIFHNSNQNCRFLPAFDSCQESQ